MKYDFRKIEKKWRERWLKVKTYEPDFKKAKKSFYNLMMFPYPSAEGLHVGNMYAFVGSDVYGRLKRMQGHDVFEPIGLDGFGIHSENYALKIGTHPREQAKISERRFYKQLHAIGNGFAWDERLETYDPEYYKWTQWIFIQLFKRGLAYRKKQAVNWCPSCKTVLADEQVIQKQSAEGRGQITRTATGVCERCGTRVVKKELEQWFFRITRYAEKLLGNLDKLDWSDRVKIAQRNWIGKSEGALIKFQVSGVKNHEIEVFTTRPDTLFGATFMAVAPEHELIKNLESRITNYGEVAKYVEKVRRTTELMRQEEINEKTGVEIKGIKAINPATKEEIPVWVADYVAIGYGTGAIMGVPAHDERDFVFARKYKLSIKEVIQPWFRIFFHYKTPLIGQRTEEKIERLPFQQYSQNGNRVDLGGSDLNDIKLIDEIRDELHVGTDYFVDENSRDTFQWLDSGRAVTPWVLPGKLVDSGRFSNMDSETAKWEITKFVGGKRVTRYKLRDWLISRQRYWGPPIPMIFCEHCRKKSWVNPKSLPDRQAGEIRNPKRARGKLENPGWTPVPEKDLPVKLPFVKDFRPKGKGVSPLASVKSFYETKCPKCGGKARRETDVSDTFLDSAWYHIGYLMRFGNWKLEIGNSAFRTLVKRWLPVDMYIGGAEHSVLHLLYVRFLALALHDMKYINFAEPFPKFRAHGLLIKEGGKMSKSKGNVVNPDEYIEKFGADALRMYLMFLAPFEQGGDFRDAGILGITRFLERVWRLFQKGHNSDDTKDERMLRILHRTIKKVTEDIENLRYNTAISALMILVNEMERRNQLPATGGSTALSSSSVGSPPKGYQLLIKLLAPFAPHLAEEIWRDVLGNKTSVHTEPWPTYDPKLVREETVKIAVQINGKVRGKIELAADAGEDEARAKSEKDDNVARHLAGIHIKKVIYVPGKIINFVTSAD